MKELLELIEHYSINENLTNKTVNNFLDEVKTKKLCLFGAGMTGRVTATLLMNKGIKVDFFCDNDTSKCNREFIYKSISCINYEKLKIICDETIVLICTIKAHEVAKQLDNDHIRYYMPLARELLQKEFWQNNNISNYRDEIIKSYNNFEDEFSKTLYIKCIRNWFDGKFESFKDVCSPDQYFLKEVMPLNDHESFADIGSFNGDTIKEFLEVTNNSFDRIYSFELTKESFQELVNYVNKLPLEISRKIKMYNIGLGHCHETVWYYPQEMSSFATVGEGGNSNLIEARLAPFDDIVDEKITFIKMDIEGAELSALKGAKKTIQKYMPKLAICVYHKPQDLWEIPLYIRAINPEYKLFLRHHTVYNHDTVCYAI